MSVNVKRYNNNLSVMEELQNRGISTSDFEVFRKRVEIPVLIYDDYKLGCWNGRFFQEGCNYYGEGVTLASEFSMKRTDGDQCLVFDKQKEEPRGKVRGDIFGVSPEHMIVLDKVMDNNIKNFRREILVMLEDQDHMAGRWTPAHKGRPYVKCWMYLSNPLWYAARPIHYTSAGKSGRVPEREEDPNVIIYAYDFKERAKPIRYASAIGPHGGWPDANDEQWPLGIGGVY